MRRRVHPRTRAGGRVRRRQVPRQRDAGNGGRGRSERSERSPPQSLSSSRCNHIYRKETDQRVAILPPRPLMQIIEQANRPYSSVEWHFVCSMRAKGRHRAGVSALQPPGTPLALLDELHEGQRVERHKTITHRKT